MPFCAHRCSYCSFVALEGRSEESDYFEGLEREIRSFAASPNDRCQGRASRATERSPTLDIGHSGKGFSAIGAAAAAPNISEISSSVGGFDTVYFGGGTPSYVDARRLGRVLGTLEETFGLSSDVEVTAEANPDDLDARKLGALKDAGINRLSIGVQSLVDAELVPLERRHDGAAARRAVSEAARAFGNVSADLMIGIPGQTRATLLGSLEGLLEAGVSHLSAYLLEIDKAPKLVALRKEHPTLFAGDDEMADCWEAVDERLTAAGLPRYELSNWARPGFESRHNLKYWTLVPVFGFGVGAHSFDGRTRFANTGMLAEYLKRTGAEISPVATFEESGDSDLLRRKEGLMLGLRLSGGVPSSSFEEICRTLPAASAERIRDAFEAGLLEESAGAPGGRGERRVRLTRRGVLLSNEVFSLLV
ncbi:MAG: coproporphyrinogen-III oxidase family protein [Acidobacteriota bacterium]